MSGSHPTSSRERADGQRLILVVDDEPGIRAMVLASISVKASRYNVVEAGNAADAVALARERRPDLVLLDVVLPDRDGFWVCRELKADALTSHIRVVMLTAMGLSSDRVQALKAGADGYIAKPFSPRALLAQLDRRLP
jgi:DNA-binding response OmpR family regulator